MEPWELRQPPQLPSDTHADLAAAAERFRGTPAAKLLEHPLARCIAHNGLAFYYYDPQGKRRTLKGFHNAYDNIMTAGRRPVNAEERSRMGLDRTAGATQDAMVGGRRWSEREVGKPGPKRGELVHNQIEYYMRHGMPALVRAVGGQHNLHPFTHEFASVLEANGLVEPVFAELPIFDPLAGVGTAIDGLVLVRDHEGGPQRLGLLEIKTGHQSSSEKSIFNRANYCIESSGGGRLYLTECIRAQMQLVFAMDVLRRFYQIEIRPEDCMVFHLVNAVPTSVVEYPLCADISGPVGRALLQRLQPIAEARKAASRSASRGRGRKKTVPKAGTRRAGMLPAPKRRRRYRARGRGRGAK